MSTYTRQICPLRARKDIVCYKVFGRSFDNLHIITPYQRMRILKPTENNPILMDDVSIDVDEKDIDIITPWAASGYKTGKFKRIGRGMIHAYTYPIIPSSCCFLYKCIIPKGTLYYKGINNNICAKKMLIVEQID